MFGAFFKRDPTRRFTRTLHPPLTWDTRNGSLNGITPGDALESLAPLGPASRHTAPSLNHHNLEYADLGIMAIAIDKLTDAIIFAFSAIEDQTIDPNFQSAVLHIGPHGPTLSKSTRLDDVENHFGQPRERNIDVDEATLFYDIGRLTYEFDFALDGTITTLTIYTIEEITESNADTAPN